MTILPDAANVTMRESIQITGHVRRIEAVEKELKALADRSAGKEDVSRIRAEMKKLYDGLHIGQLTLLVSHAKYLENRALEFLTLRSHVWGMREYSWPVERFLGHLTRLVYLTEEDLHSLSKKVQKTV